MFGQNMVIKGLLLELLLTYRHCSTQIQKNKKFSWQNIRWHLLGAGIFSYSLGSLGKDVQRQIPLYYRVGLDLPFSPEAMVDLLLWLPRFKSCAVILLKMSLSNEFILITVLAYLETAYLASSQGRRSRFGSRFLSWGKGRPLAVMTQTQTLRSNPLKDVIVKRVHIDYSLGLLGNSVLGKFPGKEE
jgi:hypothetical protein